MRKLFLTYIILLSCAFAWAQNNFATDFPYECSFEDTEDLSAWVRNVNNTTTTDRWIFGSAVHSDGRKSLYVSADGQTPNYGKNPDVTVAMLRYKFPDATNRQSYDISFDWKGTGDSAKSELYVMLDTEEKLTENLNNILSSTGGRLSNDLKSSCQSLNISNDSVVKGLYGGAGWQNVSLNPVGIPANKSSKVFTFLFIWVNANQQDSVKNTSIAIDNFQINSNQIEKPANLNAYAQCEDSTMLVTWESDLAWFDIQYRKVGDPNWGSGISGITEDPTGGGFIRENGTDCSFVLKRILEGSYDVRIRGKYIDPETNDELRTGYVYKSNILVYCPDNHCVNYVDLHGPNVKCTYGKHEAHEGQTPYDSIGVIDYGPDSENSKHTLHVDPNETDPRTGDSLHTVPPGALASVRLGNWNPDGNGQSIIYDILVDTTTQGILIMKYAVVLDNSGHDRFEEPYFRIEILDSLENPLRDGDVCGRADFTYRDAVELSENLESWHLTRYQGEELAWKEWTTVGIPLMDYHNQHIKVRITSADCGQWVHFGYGYFTLDCANAHIDTENCGNDAQVNCVAPDGFKYAWYKGDPDNGELVDTTQTLVVEAIRQVYTCRVSFIEEPTCYFDISTTSEPRFPVPEFSWEWLHDNCESRLKFTNTSHVMNMFSGEETRTQEPCNETHWVFRRLSDGRITTATTPYNTSPPTYLCPEIGDSIEVACTSYIGANNSCDSTVWQTIGVPSIVPRDSAVRVIICSEDPYKFDGQWFDSDTVYKAVTPNFAGCDSTNTLYLKVYPKPEDQYIHDSICSDQSLVINGVIYNKTITDSIITLKTENGCDSVIYLTLTVNERLQAQFDETLPYACSDEEQLFIVFDIQAGVYDSLKITFDSPLLHDTVIYENETSIAIPFDAEEVLPGHYSATMTFYQFCCGTYTQTRGIDIRYRSSIVEQKWSDVLTLLAPKYNGGWEFVSYQWYKNGMPIAGANHSYLYEPLDFDALYYVEVMRTDSVVMTTCPVQPVYHEQQTEYPTIVQAGQQIPMYMDYAATVWYYTVSGQLYGTFDLPQGYTSLAVPAEQGVFVIKAVNAQGETHAQIMIVE